MAETATVPQLSTVSLHDGVEASPRKSAKHGPDAKKRASIKSENPNGVTKPKQSKSRNGCITCKAKRLKCDETHPTCQNCAKRSVVCGGYKKDFKWRPFEETTFSTKPVPTKPRKAVSPPDVSFQLQTAAQLSPAFEAAQAAIIGQSPSSASSVQSPRDRETPGPRVMLPVSSPPLLSPHLSFTSPQYPQPISPFFASSTPVAQAFQNQILPDVPADSMAAFDSTEPYQPPRTPSGISGQSPKLADLLSPGTDMGTPAPEYYSFMSQYQDTIAPVAPVSPMLDTEIDDDDIEEISRPELNQQWNGGLSSASPSSTPSEAPVAFWGTDNPYTMFKEPQFGAGSPEMMTMRFDRQTCGILSVKDGPTENPWRTLIWPMARDSPALYHAVASMTSFHVSGNQPHMRVQGLEHMRASIHTLANGIANMSLETAIATTLTLAFSESWDQHISTGIDHIKGAKVLVSQALTKHKHSAYQGEKLNRLKFLCNTWVYMDVIARLTSADSDDSNDFDTVYDMLPEFSKFGGPEAELELDPLMGCAQTLFPIIGRVANLVRKCRACEHNTPAMISLAVDLKGMLEGWMPPTVVEEPEDPTSHIQESLQTAEAYRWATLLYLHQAVPEIPSLSSADLAEQVLIYLATVPLISRTVIIQIYPLTAAGCEAADEATRTFVRERWEAMAARMKIGVIDRCLEVTKEVWSRRDAYEAKRHNSTASLPVNLKRSFTVGDEEEEDRDWQYDLDGFGAGKRRATAGVDDLPRPARLAQSQRKRKQSSDARTGFVDREYTVRGSLHWLGVMRDWNWEVLLG